MLPTLSARSGGSKYHRAGAMWNRFAICLCLAATCLNAQIAGSITIRNLPTYASGASAMDSAGNLYIGTAATAAAPTTPGAAQTQFGGNACGGSGLTAVTTPKIGLFPFPPTCDDAYLTKVDRNGNTVYATFLGGPLNNGASALAVDSTGNLYVTGITSGSFPTTSTAAIATSTTSTGFAAKLSKDGSTFLYVTYLPANMASVSAIAVDGQGNAYISGRTAASHAVVIKVSADGSAFLYTTILSGSGQEDGGALVVDAAGDSIVSGITNSPDFPVTAGAVQSKLGGAHDQFVTKLDPSGNIVFSTYLGGSGDELGASMQTDAAGNIYLGGGTQSTDFPSTAGSYQSTPAVPIWNNAFSGGFLASLSPDGRLLRYSTYILTSDGYANVAGPGEIAVGTAGDVYLLDAALAGSPVTSSAPQPCYNGGDDVFLAHFGPQGQLEDSTFLGEVPSHASLPSNNYLPSDGTVMVLSGSAGTPTGPAFVQVRFGEPGWTAPACLTPAVLNSATLTTRGVVAAGEVVSLVGAGIGPATGVPYQPGPQGQAPTMLGGVQVFFDGIAAPVLYVQSNQVNAVVPVEMSGQTSASVTLRYQATTFGPFTQQIAYFDPAIFRSKPGTSSQAAAINQDGSINGPSNPAPAGTIISLWGTGLGALSTPCSDGNLNVDAAVFLAPGYSTVISGQNSIPVLYSGGAPLLLCGAMQINMQIPAGTPSGNFGIYPWAEYRSGNLSVASQSNLGATIVVK